MVVAATHASQRRLGRTALEALIARAFRGDAPIQ
jgi:hypothetical protein